MMTIIGRSISRKMNHFDSTFSLGLVNLDEGNEDNDGNEDDEGDEGNEDDEDEEKCDEDDEDEEIKVK